MSVCSGDRCRHPSANAFCSALFGNWDQNGIRRSSSVSATTLCQRLRQALLLYMDCQGVVEDCSGGHLATGSRRSERVPLLWGSSYCSREAASGDGENAAVPGPSAAGAGPWNAEAAAVAEGRELGRERAVAAWGPAAAASGDSVSAVIPGLSAGDAGPSTPALGGLSQS